MSTDPDLSEPVQPLDVDGVTAVAVGTVAWAVLAVVAFALHDRLAAAGHEWWAWVCVAGAGLGLLGLPYVVHRSRSARAAPDAGAGRAAPGG